MNALTWQQELIARHPEIFVRKTAGRPFSPAYPTCGYGWSEIVTRAVERVSAAGAGCRLHFSQIREKDGSLRMYWKADASVPETIEQAIQDAVALAEARSACTCEVCGSPGRLYCSGSFVMTRCPVHARGFPFPVREGFENLHLVLVSRDGARVMACRRYDRATDRFVAVDAAALGPQA